MPHNSSDLSSAHVPITASDLDGVTGGKGLGPFPGAEVGSAAGQGILSTVQNRGNIANAFSDAHRWGHEKGWGAINSVGNYFNNNVGSTYTPATMNPGGSITPGVFTP
ncbi:MAG: hypothetical protein ACKV2T_39340 [Kofleriaceae bacterium]